MKRLTSLVAILLVALALSLSSRLIVAQSETSADTSVTSAAGGIYPPGTTFNGVPLNGLQFASGVEIRGDSSAIGQFTSLLLGISALGVKQNITVECKATTGSRTAVNIATFSGTCTIDMGDGTPPLPDVPFTATVTTNDQDQGSLGLVLGATTLPAATVNEGSMTIK
ncbi:MAG: hypothetical protein LC808_37985 [Actinobacteria bacterium]|nr:hypothetical protein [Actinomycetota bacterium]